MKLKIDEAIAQARINGRKLLKKDIAAKLWPESDQHAQAVNMSKLVNGQTQTIRPEFVKIICEMCNCTADYLLGI